MQHTLQLILVDAPRLFGLYVHTDCLFVHFDIELNGDFDQFRFGVVAGEKTLPWGIFLEYNAYYSVILANIIGMFDKSLCFRLDTDLGGLLLHIDFHRDLQYLLFHYDLRVGIVSLHFTY